MSTADSADELSGYLSDMNQAGKQPVVVGFDRDGDPFLAYGWAPGGDGWDCGMVQDDTHSAEFDYSDGTEQCQECGAFERRGIEKLHYPVTIIRASGQEAEHG